MSWRQLRIVHMCVTTKLLTRYLIFGPPSVGFVKIWSICLRACDVL